MVYKSADLLRFDCMNSKSKNINLLLLLPIAQCKKSTCSESDSIPEWKSIKLLVLSRSENGHYLVSNYKRRKANLTFLGFIFKIEDNVYEHFSEFNMLRKQRGLKK